MRLLWTISNWKRTGPVQPSLDLAAAVAALGHDVRVEVGRAPPDEDQEASAMRAERGLRPALVGARLHKHAFFLRDRPDVRRLAAWIERERPDAVVTTLANDHRLALAARARSTPVPVHRLWFADGEGDIAPRERDGLLSASRVFVFGGAPARRLAVLGVPDERVRRLGPPLDVAGLRTQAQAGDSAWLRSHLSLPSDVFLFGIVARMQRHRRFEMLWAAADELRQSDVAFRLVVLGRGTYQEEVGARPVRERGLEARVSFAGYLRGAEYARALEAFDAQLLLVPGSDPTCRALREGMALGAPSIATRRGLLPSIVVDGETGILVDETPHALADAMRRLAENPAEARRMGEAAAARAARTFSSERVATDLLAAMKTTVS